MQGARQDDGGFDLTSDTNISKGKKPKRERETTS